MRKILNKYLKEIFYTFILFLTIYLTINNINILQIPYENFANWLYPNNENRNGEFLKILLSFIGGLGIIYGLYISLKRVKAMEKGVEKQGEAIKNQSKQIELTRKAQTDERFKNAVEHLGSDKEPIIIGGIVEMHQIAKDNPKEYSEIIFNLLCSYVRTNSSVNKNITIIQTIFDFLFIDKMNNPYRSYKANLKRSNLLGIEMKNYTLKDADLSDCSFSNIENTNFENANLKYSYFFTSHLKNVNFYNANFYKTYFYNAEIQNCEFRNYSEHLNISFIECSIKDMNFENLIIQNWKFIACDIVRTNFIKSEILFTNFSATRFSKVTFSDLIIFSSNNFKASIFTKVIMSDLGTKNIFNGSKEDGIHYGTHLRNIDALIGSNTVLDGIENINIEKLKTVSLNSNDALTIREEYIKNIKDIYKKTKAKRYEEILNDELYEAGR